MGFLLTHLAAGAILFSSANIGVHADALSHSFSYVLFVKKSWEVTKSLRITIHLRQIVVVEYEI